MPWRRLYSAVTIAASLLMSSAFATETAKPQFTFRLADDSIPGQTLSDTAQRWADEINAESHGRIRVQHFTNKSLGDDLSLIQGLRNGSIDMLATAIPNLTGVEASLGLFSTPFLVEDSASARRLADSPVAAKL